MNNNEIPTIGGMPNPNQNQPINQPTFQQTPQPIQNQPIIQSVSNTPNGNSQNSKKKIGLIIGCSVGAVAVIAVVAILLITLLKHKEKTVSCTMNTSAMGIALKSDTNVKIKDGEISSGDITINVDLKTMQNSYKDYEKDIVDELTENYKQISEEPLKSSTNQKESK